MGVEISRGGPTNGERMRYLIDGYNLLHAMGLLLGKVGPHGLEKARLALLGRLHGRYGADAGRVTVVFDASRAPPGAAAEMDYNGVQVRFALREEADDVIEELIRTDSSPRRLTVVSDDHRLQNAARRRHCPVLGCLDFLDELSRPRPAAAGRPKAPAKPEAVSRADLRRWMDAFGDLDDDPRLGDALNFGPLDEDGD
jgi:predicted RNA-binding protein with PIN domain